MRHLWHFKDVIVYVYVIVNSVVKDVYFCYWDLKQLLLHLILVTMLSASDETKIVTFKRIEYNKFSMLNTSLLMVEIGSNIAAPTETAKEKLQHQSEIL